MDETDVKAGGMFEEPKAERGFPTGAVAIAAVAVVILVGVVVMLQRRPGAALKSDAAYAAKLEVGQVQMSEAESQTGGKQTYLDGKIVNHGASTVTGVVVQVTFGNDQAVPAQVETVPMNLIYMREPYLDTRPVTLAPGAEGEFRLIFDDVKDNWNQQVPEIKVVRVGVRG